MDTKLYLADVRPLADEALFMRLLPCVSDARRAKVTAFKHEGARRLSLGAGLLLRFALRSEGLSAGEIAVRTGLAANAVRRIISRVRRMVAAVESELDV